MYSYIQGTYSAYFEMVGESYFLKKEEWLTGKEVINLGKIFNVF